jgi:hypothetical protein
MSEALPMRVSDLVAACADTNDDPIIVCSPSGGVAFRFTPTVNGVVIIDAMPMRLDLQVGDRVTFATGYGNTSTGEVFRIKVTPRTTTLSIRDDRGQTWMRDASRVKRLP